MLALFSFGSTKLARIMRLAVIGAVALGVVGIGGSVWANPPDGNGNHNHCGGGGDDGGGGGAPTRSCSRLNPATSAIQTRPWN